MVAKGSPRALGTALRRLVELLDGEVQRAYEEAGLDYRATYTPVVRSLIDSEALSVRELAITAGVSHAAASSTVGQMRRRGLLEPARSSDGRERRVQLTASARDMLPRLRTLWQRTQRAEHALDAELGFSLSAAVNAAVDAVERRPFMIDTPSGRGEEGA